MYKIYKIIPFSGYSGNNIGMGWFGPIGFYFKEVGPDVSRTFLNYRKEINASR